LGVGAVQNPEIVQWNVLGAVQALDLAQNIERLILFVVRLVDGDRRAGVVVCHRVFSLRSLFGAMTARATCKMVLVER